MARLFISHSSANNGAALALGEWLSEQGFDDVFLDIDPDRGLNPGDRWQEQLRAAADRCQAVLFLVSPAWLDSKWCLAEFLLAKNLGKRIFGLIVEPVPFERLPAEMTAEWQLCELTGEDRYRRFDVPVFGKTEQIAFREAGLDRLRRGLERAGLDAKSFPWPPRDDPKRAPYRGFKALEPQDAAIFFGRDAAIVRGLDRIRGAVESGVEKMLVVLGASGSGKSSFMRAGLWPRLARDDATFMPLPPIRPQTAVMTGSTGLAAALAASFDGLNAAKPLGAIKEALQGGDDALGGLLDELTVLAKRRLVTADDAGADPAIILPLDQAEELFNPEGANEARIFLEMLARVLGPADDKPARRLVVVATMRSDRYELLQGEPHLADIRQEPFNLPPLPLGEFKSVIEGPARRVREAGGKLDIDPALVEQLIADAQGPDALPLLAFTLERLFADYGAGEKLTVAEYDKLGGIKGAIEEAVAQALAEPARTPAIPATKEAQLAAMRAAFIPWLARIDPDTGAPMRRVANRDEIPPDSRAVVERLVAARLLVADRRAGIDVIEVAHESLLRQWPALTAWLDADAADLKQIEGIERAAAEWARNGEGEAWLDHRGDRLAQAERLIARADFRRRIGETGARYLARCRGRDEAERKAKEDALAREQARLAEIATAQARTARLQRRTRWGLALVALAVAAGLGAGFWQIEQRQRALDEGHVNLLAAAASAARIGGNLDSALRLSVHAARLGFALDPSGKRTPFAGVEIASDAAQSDWLFVLRGHDSAVVSALFSPDGSRILTASWDKTARLWDAQTGAPLAVFRGHAALLSSAAFSADGKRVVTASSDTTIRIWEAATGKQIASIGGHPVAAPGANFAGGAVSSASFSPDGQRLVTSAGADSAQIWDIATGKQTAVLKGHEKWLWSAAFSPDGARIVTASGDRTARVWDAVTGKQIAVLTGHLDQVFSARFSPDGSRIVTASWDRTARIWDIATAKELVVLRGHLNYVRSAAFSPDGQSVVTASADGTARIWNAANGEEIAVLRGHELDVFNAAYSPDGSRIVTAAQDGTARVWPAEPQHALTVLRGHDGAVYRAAYSPDGSTIVTASGDRTVGLWDARSGNPLGSLEGHPHEVTSAAFSKDGSKIVTVSTDSVRLWSAATRQQIAVLTTDGAPNVFWSAAFSPDGAKIVTASLDNAARLWDAATGKVIATLKGHDGFVSAATFNPDGSRILTASGDHTGRLWDAATGKEVAVLRGHDYEVLTAAFSPDGSRIATGAEGRTALIWDTATATPLIRLHGHSGPIWSIAYSPDGTRLVTGSADGTARIWDAATGREIVAVRGHQGALSSAVFSPDGTRILTASADKTARIWDVHRATMPTLDLIAETCRRLLPGLSTLTREEMRLAGYPDTMSQIDVCAGVGGAAPAAP